MNTSHNSTQSNVFGRLFRFQFSLKGLLVLTAIAAISIPILSNRLFNMPDRVPVSSSSLQSVGYNWFSKTLEVEFVNGSIYRYENIPRQVHQNLMTAKSHGRYFHNNIRKGGYDFDQVQ